MIKEALQYLIGLGNTRIEKDGNQVYSTQPLYSVNVPTPDALSVRSLSGLIEYLQSDFDQMALPLMVQVVSPIEVYVFSSFNRDFQRNYLIKATAMPPNFDFNRWYDPEQFNIKLQSCFVKASDRDTVLKIVGNLKEENVKNFGDDGISQSVQAKSGIATVENVKVPNPVLLKPYRTFVEVDQPESAFVFRMQNGPSCALFEADGGAWKLEAMANIKNYLQEKMADEVIDEKIVIIA